MGASKAFGKKAPQQPHLIGPGGGLAGEIFHLREQVDEAFLSTEKGGIIVKYFGQAPTDAANSTGIMSAQATVAADTTYSGANFDGVLAPGSGDAFIRSPKKITITAGGGTPANFTGGNIVVTGKDIDGKALVETVAAAAGAGTTTTVNYFAQVTSVFVPAQAGTGATVAIGVAADTASIASITSSTSAQVIDTNAEFNRARVGNRPMPMARRISFAFSNNADWDATNGTIEGLDILGNAISETFAIPNGGNSTVSTTKFYAQVTRISIPAQSGAGGTCSVGFLNTDLGLDVDPISAVEAVAVLREASEPGTGVWAAVGSAGAVDPASVTNAAPYGRYVPNTAPNGVASYVVAYIPNPA